jgi:hypothetical protein
LEASWLIDTPTPLIVPAMTNTLPNYGSTSVRQRKNSTAKKEVKVEPKVYLAAERTL